MLKHAECASLAPARSIKVSGRSPAAFRRQAEASPPTGKAPSSRAPPAPGPVREQRAEAFHQKFAAPGRLRGPAPIDGRNRPFSFCPSQPARAVFGNSPRLHYCFKFRDTAIPTPPPGIQPPACTSNTIRRRPEVTVAANPRVPGDRRRLRANLPNGCKGPFPVRAAKFWRSAAVLGILLGRRADGTSGCSEGRRAPVSPGVYPGF